MARITTYIIIIVILVILFNAVGLLVDTPLSSLLNWAINPEDADQSSAFLILLGVAGLVSASVVTIAALITGKIDIGLLAPFVIFVIGTLVWDLVAIFGIVADSTNTILATIIFSPLIIGMVVDAIAWWTARS